MRLAFVLFDRLTALDLIGAYDPLVRLKTMGLLPELTWNFCATSKRIVDDRGLIFTPTQVDESLATYDLLLVPGGFGTRELSTDHRWLEWLRTAEGVPLKASVCTGALLLGAAGWLRGKRATTHWTALDALAPFCERVVDERVVDDGEVVTAGGVTAAIDLGLHLVQRIAGEEAAHSIARQMDYRRPPSA